MLAVFINPGRTPEQPEPNLQEWGDRTTNRPAEYNTPDDKYARIVTEELMPVLYKDFSISKDPDQHGIAGVSSGGIAAFQVAWERPDDFRKVFTIVGSFVNLRGGYVYPDRVLAAAQEADPRLPVRRAQRQPRPGTPMARMTRSATGSSRTSAWRRRSPTRATT
jgi:enterochelin esterase-like enzyme